MQRQPDTKTYRQTDTRRQIYRQSSTKKDTPKIDKYIHLDIVRDAQQNKTDSQTNRQPGTQIDNYKHRQRQKNRQADRKIGTDRNKDNHTHRQTARHSHTRTCIGEQDRQTDIQTARHANRQLQTQIKVQTEICTYRQPDIVIHAQKNNTARQTDRQTDTCR